MCSIAADVVFVLDASGSMVSDYGKEKKLVNSLMDQFHIGEKKMRVGFVVFGSYAKKHSAFVDTKSTSMAKAALENAPFIGGHSRVDLGLNEALHLFEGVVSIESFYYCITYY